MKPNKYQIELAKSIAGHILNMVETNDIKSPSHSTLNEEEADQIAEEYYSYYDTKTEAKNKELATMIELCFASALAVIRKLNNYEENNNQ